MRTTWNLICVLAVMLASATTLAASGAMVGPGFRHVDWRQDQDEEKKKKKDKPADQAVTGGVADRDGKPIERAQVMFDGPKKATLLTDAAGRFTFNGPPGDYTITVRKGEQSTHFTRKVEGNQLKPNATLTIELEEPPQ